jgi:hypothetical protein
MERAGDGAGGDRGRSGDVQRGMSARRERGGRITLTRPKRGDPRRPGYFIVIPVTWHRHRELGAHNGELRGRESTVALVRLPRNSLALDRQGAPSPDACGECAASRLPDHRLERNPITIPAGPWPTRRNGTSRPISSRNEGSAVRVRASALLSLHGGHGISTSLTRATVVRLAT